MLLERQPRPPLGGVRCLPVLRENCPFQALVTISGSTGSLGSGLSWLRYWPCLLPAVHLRWLALLTSLFCDMGHQSISVTRVPQRPWAAFWLEDPVPWALWLLWLLCLLLRPLPGSPWRPHLPLTCSSSISPVFLTEAITCNLIIISMIVSFFPPKFSTFSFTTSGF